MKGLERDEEKKKGVEGRLGVRKNRRNGREEMGMGE